MTDAPSFTPPVRKLTFTLFRFPENVIQPVINIVTAIVEAVGAELIVELDKDVKDERLPDSIHFVS